MSSLIFQHFSFEKCVRLFVAIVTTMLTKGNPIPDITKSVFQLQTGLGNLVSLNTFKITSHGPALSIHTDMSMVTSNLSSMRFSTVKLKIEHEI